MYTADLLLPKTRIFVNLISFLDSMNYQRGYLNVLGLEIRYVAWVTTVNHSCWWEHLS